MFVRDSGLDFKYLLFFYDDDYGTKSTVLDTVPVVYNAMCYLLLGSMDSQKFWNGRKLSTLGYY